MKRFLPCCLLLALIVSAPAAAATSVSVGITLGNAPPPPVMGFHSEPQFTIMAHTGLGYYEGHCDYDYFRYGRYFYVYSGNYWYRSKHYRGPFVAIHESYVPTVFYGLHDRGYRWHHGWNRVPPGQAKMVAQRQQYGEHAPHAKHAKHAKHAEHGEHGHGHDKD